MAKYQVTYRCGHEETVQLFGKTKDRYSKIEWMENQLCKECWKEEQAKAAAEAAEEKGLVELEGSEKQVKWALSIREAFIKKSEDTQEYMLHIARAAFSAGTLTDSILRAAVSTPQETKSIFEKVISGVMQERSAKFWIENMREGYYSEYEADTTIEKRFVAAIKAKGEEKKTAKSLASRVMSRAWEIARLAAKKFACKVKEVVFSECLKQAWAEARA